MEFKEGVHKSSARETMFEPEPELESGHQPNKRVRWFLALVLLVCIVVGSVVSFQMLRNPRTTGPTAQVHHGWCSVPVAGLHTSVGIPELNGIDAVSARDIWMAGYLASQNSNTANQALIEHWNGTRLSVMPGPNIGKNGDRLNAITEIAPDNVWAIGSVLQTPQSPNSLGDFLAGIHTLIEHWDGHEWSIVPSPDAASRSNELLGVAAVSADDIWAVGYSFHDALVEHWDGSQWSVMKFPASFHSTVLKAVIAPAKDDIWVAGYADAPTGQSLAPLLAHWDGHQWSQIPGLNKDLSLLSLQASSPHDIWLAGEIQSGQLASSSPSNSPGPSGLTVIAHWDGVSLQQKTLPKLLLQVKQSSYDASIPVYQDQASVSVHSLNDVWVAGGQPGLAQSATTVPVFIEHWDGQSWKVASLPQEHVGLLSVLAVVDGKVWAAGTTYKGLQQTPDQLVETTC